MDDTRPIARARLGVIALCCLAAACSHDDVPQARDAAGSVGSDATTDAVTDLDAAPEADAAAQDLAHRDPYADGVCFAGSPPAADAFVADIAKPAPPWTAQHAAAGTLEVEVGNVDEAGQFVPTADGDWAPLIFGVQGGVHLWTGFRVAVPGASADKRLLKVEAALAIDGQVVVDSQTAVNCGRDPSEDEPHYTNVDLNHAGLALILYIVPYQAQNLCGRWAVLHVDVTDPETGARGHAVRLLRLYLKSVVSGFGP